MVETERYFAFSITQQRKNLRKYTKVDTALRKYTNTYNAG